MLACEVDGEHLTGYSDLFIAAQKLERQVEAKDLLLPKTTTTGGSNITHSQSTGNLFPSQKLEGSHTFTIQSTTVESNKAEEDSVTKVEEEEEVESSAGEDVGTSSWCGGADQTVGYIVCFANAVKLYQTKHEIRVVDHEPFKELFQSIPPPMVDEVRVHVKEMLEAVAIHPSQSPWCNAVVFVHKKDGGLHFCIDFCKLTDRTKKDSYSLSQIQEAIESLVGVGYFTCLDLKVGFWQIAMDEASEQYTAFTMGNLGVFKCEVCHLGCAMPQLRFRD